MNRSARDASSGAAALSCFFFGATSLVVGVVGLFVGHVSWVGILLGIMIVESSARLASGRPSAVNWLLLLTLLYAALCAYPIAELILHSPERPAETPLATAWALAWGLWACLNLLLLVGVRRPRKKG